MSALAFVVPGDLDALTGGYLYDRQMVTGLRARGWSVAVHSLDTSFPQPTSAALEHAHSQFAALDDGSLVVIDGLALGGLADLLANARDRLTLVALVHHPLALETGLSAAEQAALYKAESDALALIEPVIVTSAWTRRALADYGVAGGRIAVVEPGTRPSPARAGPAQQPHRLLCVASLTPRKGHAVLLDALAGLGGWQLDCVGSLDMDRDCSASVLRQIETLGLGEHVNLLGEIEPARLSERYIEADTFVLASFMEGYGMALTEALAAGLPVISTTGGAIPHVVPRDAGLLVPPGDRAALEAALARVIDGRDVWQRLASGALKARGTLPSWGDAVERFESALTTAARA